MSPLALSVIGAGVLFASALALLCAAWWRERREEWKRLRP